MESNIFDLLRVKFLKINKEKDHTKNMKEEEKKSKEKQNSYILWDFKTHETSTVYNLELLLCCFNETM